MANTYSKIYLHLIFATKNRDNAIPPTWEKRLHTYISGIISNNDHMPIEIGGTSSHIHILIGYNINQLIPDLMRDIKSSSSRYANENRMIKCRFAWQSGYACFSYSHSQIDAVSNYIRNQHQHHNHQTLEEEVRIMLERFEIEYDPKYIIRED